jgi:hypothetical protein
MDIPKIGTNRVERSLTTILSVPEVDVALQALRHVARYDAMRLETYREKENLGKRIRVSRIGSALALRFDDVGYFNRVYCGDRGFLDKLAEIEEFYRGGEFGCELVGPPSDEQGGVSISRAGWTPAGQYAWLAHPDCNLLHFARTTTFNIRPAQPGQREMFLRAYLRAFEAEPHRIPGALRNMRHLFDRPELDFLMAWHGETLAGVAMLMRSGTTALLCAGAALPEFREMGCHVAMLGARIRLAAKSGCREIYSWAALGGQSQANMERAGLAVVGTTPCWRYFPTSGL